MKLLIAGSRDLDISPDFIEAFIRNNISWYWNKESNTRQHRKIRQIVTGNSGNVDKAGNSLVDQYYLEADLKTFDADWDKHGKAAGPIRNKQMAEYADELLLIWDGESKGSANMKKEMLKLNKPVYEVIIKTYNTEDE